MLHHATEADRLFPTPVDLIHVHVSWSPRRGWDVHVAHRHEGQVEEAKCDAEVYGPLTLVEALQVVEVSALELLPWLEVAG